MQSRNHPVWYTGLWACIAGALLLQYDLLLHLFSAPSLTHGDSFLVSFILRHWMDILSTLSWDQLTTLPMFYGFSDSLFFTEHYTIHAILAYPLYLILKNIHAVTNIFAALSLVFSCVSMYLLSWRLTHHVWASVLAGYIFSLNPFLFARYPDHLILLPIGWLPLIILFFETWIETKKPIYGLCMFLSLTGFFLTLSFSYSLYLSILFPLYIAIRMYQMSFSVRNVLSFFPLCGGIIFAVSVSIVAFFYARVFSSHDIRRTLETAILYSAHPTDWLFTGPENVLYGSIKPMTADLLPSVVRTGIYSEQNLFPGYTVLTILFIGIWKYLRTSALAWVWVFLIGGYLISLGPDIHIWDTMSIPGPYRLLYHIHPLLYAARVPARAGMFVFFGLSIVCAWTVSHMNHRPTRRHLFVYLFLLLAVLIEYLPRPLMWYTPSQDIRSVYQTLEGQKDIRVLLEYPIGNRIPYPLAHARSEDLDARYLLFATAHHTKILFNGYSGFLPDEYYRRAGILSASFPSDETLTLLRLWGVDAIMVHKDEFEDARQYHTITTRLSDLAVPALASSETLSLYDLTSWKKN